MDTLRLFALWIKQLLPCLRCAFVDNLLPKKYCRGDNISDNLGETYALRSSNTLIHKGNPFPFQVYKLPKPRLRY
jgi:hypothetical protein